MTSCSEGPMTSSSEGPMTSSSEGSVTSGVASGRVRIRHRAVGLLRNTMGLGF